MNNEGLDTNPNFGMAKHVDISLLWDLGHRCSYVKLLVSSQGPGLDTFGNQNRSLLNKKQRNPVHIQTPCLDM